MQGAAVLQRHALIRRDTPVWPFLWRGLVPLLVLALTSLIALGPFARGSIEASVQGEIREQLNAAGFSWTGLAVSGQNVTLSGIEPSAGAGERALELARQATCPTWIGHRTCAVSVLGQFSAPAPVSVPVKAAPAVASAQGCERSFADMLAGEQIEFPAGSAAIGARSGALLDQLAQQIRACPGVIRIEGYTDTIGRGALNRRLSQARAAAVREALIARGIPAERLRSRGFGARRAIADNQTESGRARNRRIEFHVVVGG
jgi:outer membrane protein OmpA-like peptidoglycan-associated protein